MRLALTINAPGRFKEAVADVGMAGRLEEAGLDTLWVGEATGFDSPSLLGHLTATTRRVELGAGVLNPFTRTPALVAMTAVALDELSNGRFVLGLGVANPQLIEGLHGLAYRGAIKRMERMIDVCRAAWAGEPIGGGPPGGGPGFSGLEPRPLVVAKPDRRIPIHVAGQGERMVELAAARADGWAPMLLVPEKFDEVFGESIQRGAARRDPQLEPLEISAGGVLAAVVDDESEQLALLARARRTLALYVGGLGSKDSNVYNRLMRRYGYEEAAEEVQDLYLAGDRARAAEALPDEFVDTITVIGTADHVRARMDAYAAVGVACLTIEPLEDPVATIARLRSIADSRDHLETSSAAP